MADSTERDLVEVEAHPETGIDRRRFIQRAGAGTVIAGGILAAPAIIGSNVAFAQGSAGGGGGDDGDLLPPDAAPDEDFCGTIVWPTPTNNNPTNSGAWITYPLTSSVPSVQLVSVVGELKGGPTAPSATNPNQLVGAPAAWNYRNLMSNARPYQGTGTVSGDSTPGLLVVQNNEGGGNTSFSSITNYQEVTFTFNTVIQNLRFRINDISATTVDPTNTTKDSFGPLVTAPPKSPVTSADYLPTNGKYRDAVGFNRPIQVVGGNTTNLAGTGTFSNPLRRTTANDWFWGLSSGYAPYNVPMDVQIVMPGPLLSFKMRFATVGGWGTQWIQLRNFTFGLCP